MGDLAPEPGLRWHGAISLRRSRRSYDGRPVAAADLDALAALADAFRPFPAARVVLVREASGALFRGIIGSYGGISGAPSALVFLRGEYGTPEQVGYTGQALVLEATVRGLDTCWVGGLFSSAHAASAAVAASCERALAISPLGHASERITAKERVLFGAGRPKRRLEKDVFAPGWSEWPGWARAAVEVVRIAPSAMSRQPWRLRMDDGDLVIAFDGRDTPRISKRLDCGIAMLHAEIGAGSAGVSGSWIFHASPDVARFRPVGSGPIIG